LIDRKDLPTGATRSFLFNPAFMGGRVLSKSMLDTLLLQVS
jgi:hypothetical protein